MLTPGMVTFTGCGNGACGDEGVKVGGGLRPGGAAPAGTRDMAGGPVRPVGAEGGVGGVAGTDGVCAGASAAVGDFGGPGGRGPREIGCKEKKQKRKR